MFLDMLLKSIKLHLKYLGFIRICNTAFFLSQEIICNFFKRFPYITFTWDELQFRDAREGGQEGASLLLPFIWRSRGSKSALFEMQPISGKRIPVFIPNCFLLFVSRLSRKIANTIPYE